MPDPPNGVPDSGTDPKRVGATVAPPPRPAPSSGPGRPVRRAAPGLRYVAAAIVALTLFVTTYAGFVTSEAGQSIENAALRGAELRSPAEREAALNVLSTITIAVFALAIAVVFILGLVLRRGGLGSLVAATMVFSAVAAEVLKDVVPRPELAPGPVWLLRNSFPSGTATVATAMAVGLLVVAPNRLRWVVLPATAVYAAVVSHAVQATGWHRLSDTIGANMLAIAVAGFALALLARFGLVQRSTGGFIDRRITSGLLVVGAGLIVIAAVLIALPATFPVLATPDGSRRAFLQTALPLLGAGVTVLALTAFARLVEPFSLGRGARAEETAAPARQRTGGSQEVDQAPVVRPQP